MTARARRGAALALAPWLAIGALPSAAGAQSDQRVAVISDLNGSYGSTAYGDGVHKAVARLLVLKPDVVIMTGDLVAGQRVDPHLSSGELEAMWAAFEQSVISPLRESGIPVALTPGNHDASAYPGFSAERAAYSARWRDDDLGLTFVDRARYPFYYAFSLGSVLYVSLDMTTTESMDPAQRAWLEALLDGERARFEHAVVFSHLPIYPVARGRETEVTADMDLENLLAGHGVDIYLSGHHHAYYPGYHGGIRYVSQACLGSGRRVLLGTSERTARAITVLDIREGKEIAVAALAAPGYDVPIDHRTLPAQIRSSVGTLVRDDLRPVR